jgi:hypothetical protein
MGWAGIKNGKLIGLVEADGFDVFVTADRQIKDQQNFSDRHISMVYLTAQDWDIISAEVPSIQAAIDAAVTGSFQGVDAESFAGRKTSPTFVGT